MATFKEICETDNMYKCDHCHKTFKAKDIKLEEAPTNIHILTPISSFKFIDKNGIIKGGGTGADEGDRVLVCPYCNEAHPFGMDLV